MAEKKNESLGDLNRPIDMNGAKVCVACKLPAGYIMRVFAQGTMTSTMPGGGTREEPVARELPERFTLKGCAQNKASPRELFGGYAITEGVPAELFDMWYRQNKDSELVKNKIIFRTESVASAIDKGRELVGIKSGMEQLDPKKLPERIKAHDKTDADLEKAA